MSLDEGNNDGIDCLTFCQVCFFHILRHSKSKRVFVRGWWTGPCREVSKTSQGLLASPDLGSSQHTHPWAQSPHLYSEDDDNNAHLRVSWDWERVLGRGSTCSFSWIAAVVGICGTSSHASHPPAIWRVLNAFPCVGFGFLLLTPTVP